MSVLQWIAGIHAGEIGNVPTTHWRVGGDDYYVASMAHKAAQAASDRIGRPVPVVICEPGKEPRVLSEAHPREVAVHFALDPL